MNEYARESAGGIIMRKDGRIVLVEQNENSWSFPKGHVEPGESLLETARREVEEETGLTKVRLVAQLGSYERYSIGPGGKGESVERGLRRRIIFLFTAEEDALQPNDPDGDISDARWVTVDEALQMLTHPKDREFLEAVRHKLSC